MSQVVVENPILNSPFAERSHLFAKPETGKSAIKVINGCADEVMTVLRV